jgi:hypothetical protein
MLLDRSKLQAGMHMLSRPEEVSKMKKNPRSLPPPPNYVKINLGSSKNRHAKPITDWVHRLVCATINGPPDVDAGLVEVVHMCPRRDQPGRFGNPGCINPLHLVFGNREDNRRAGPMAQARFRKLLELARQRRAP